MADLPVMLRVRGRRCLIVGGGTVALRRARSLTQAGATVTIVAPVVTEELSRLAVTIHRRHYQTSDLDRQWLVVIATDVPQINEQVHGEALALGVLINRADDATSGDIQIPAHHQAGPVTIAVHTDGISAQAAAAIRDQLAGTLDPSWPVLLELVRPYRQSIQCSCSDPRLRSRKLRELTGEKAMNLLRNQGIRALRQFCESLLRQDPPSTQADPDGSSPGGPWPHA